VERGRLYFGGQTGHGSHRKFFGAIRQQGGNSDNPTPVQFTRAFRKLFFSSFLESLAGNCDQDLDTLLAQFSKDKSNMPVLVSPKEQPNTLDIGAQDYSDKNVGDGLIAKPMQVVMWQGI
jgi:hypothetical protein